MTTLHDARTAIHAALTGEGMVAKRITSQEVAVVDTVGEYRVREIARQSAEEAVKLFAQRLGIEDIAEVRGDLDHLRRLVKAADGRTQEARKTMFTVIGGMILAVLSYLAAAFTMKGHP